MSNETPSHKGDGNSDERGNGTNDQSEQSKQAEIKSFFDGLWRWIETYFPCPADEDSTEGKKRCRYKEAIKFWMEVGGFFLGIVVAVIFYYQWSEMQEDRNLDERAWISETKWNLKPPYDANHVLSVITEIVNTGKTPAKIETIDVSFGKSLIDSTNIVVFQTDTTGNFTMGPNQTYPIEITETNTLGNDYVLLSQGFSKRSIFVKITYRDIFNIVRHTDFGVNVRGNEDYLKNGAGFTPYGNSRMD
jgi:hypothetical protein